MCVCDCVYSNIKEKLYFFLLYCEFMLLYFPIKKHFKKILELFYRYIVTGCIFHVLRKCSFDKMTLQLCFNVESIWKCEFLLPKHRQTLFEKFDVSRSFFSIECRKKRNQTLYNICCNYFYDFDIIFMFFLYVFVCFFMFLYSTFCLLQK